MASTDKIQHNGQTGISYFCSAILRGVACGVQGMVCKGQSVKCLVKLQKFKLVS